MVPTIDRYYLFLVIPALLISMWAQVQVKSTFARYNRVPNRRGYTGAMLARQILDENGLQHIRIERVAGQLSDHYSPKEDVIRLSDSTYNSTSVGALGVAAHEVGHAIQYDVGYFPIKIRNALIPITQIGSSVAIPLAILGLILSFPLLTEIGILLFCAVVLFQLFTLPVEFNASRRAVRTLDEDGILDQDELKGAKKVLSAAAMTYVAALIVAIANLARLLALRDRNQRR
ncbi:MAG: zinc metallopeptidase [Candidatus Merdivicinus sp.]